LSEYRIFETDPFCDDIDAIARSGQRRVLEKLREVVYPQLRARPQFGANIRKLRNYAPSTWRYRIGSWRFFYEIDEEEKIIFMTTAAHRGSAY
jgi:mRNA interferase RelE/StbE